MITEIHHKGQLYTIDSSRGIDLSVKNLFDGKNPVFFGANQPSILPVQSSEFIGDVKQGGTCNVFSASVDIHCTGTHTECIGHVKDSNIQVPDVCPSGFIFSQLISVSPEAADRTNDSYHIELSTDLIITKHILEEKIAESHKALILRTLPNMESKKSRNYDKHPAPFFTNDAIDYLNELAIEHLLVDLPSIDKADDNGQLGNHHLFFKQGKTISELLYIPNSVSDGFGFLQIQIPNWGLDAAPSRPIFYPVEF